MSNFAALNRMNRRLYTKYRNEAHPDWRCTGRKRDGTRCTRLGSKAGRCWQH